MCNACKGISYCGAVGHGGYGTCFQAPHAAGTPHTDPNGAHWVGHSTTCNAYRSARENLTECDMAEVEHPGRPCRHYASAEDINATADDYIANKMSVCTCLTLDVIDEAYAEESARAKAELAGWNASKRASDLDAAESRRVSRHGWAHINNWQDGWTDYAAGFPRGTTRRMRLAELTHCLEIRNSIDWQAEATKASAEMSAHNWEAELLGASVTFGIAKDEAEARQNMADNGYRFAHENACDCDSCCGANLPDAAYVLESVKSEQARIDSILSEHGATPELTIYVCVNCHEIGAASDSASALHYAENYSVGCDCDAPALYYPCMDSEAESSRRESVAPACWTMELGHKSRPILTRTASQTLSTVWDNLSTGQAISSVQIPVSDRSRWADYVPVFLRDWMREEGRDLGETFGHMV
jgi:hypothetical protein